MHSLSMLTVGLAVLAGLAKADKTDYVFYEGIACDGNFIESKDGLPIGTCR